MVKTGKKGLDKSSPKPHTHPIPIVFYPGQDGRDLNPLDLLDLLDSRIDKISPLCK